MKKTFVTKPYFPPLEIFKSRINDIWANEHLTNHGPLLLDLEKKLSVYLGTPFFYFVTNGTLALQIAIRALDITEGEIITTPFSYVATTSSILWERCKPVFVDIDPETFCIDTTKVESAITRDTKAIMAVHVFGYPCDVDAIADIAKRHNLKVIYDGAHAFGCKYKGKSLLDYGDIATCSFHATKVYHSVEGGCIISHSEDTHKKIFLQRSFGHIADDHFELGINAKASELQAAMGLCVLDDFPDILLKRKKLKALYDSFFNTFPELQRPYEPDDFEYNYGYYPVVFETSLQRENIQNALNTEHVFPRRYFYPSLNTLPYLTEKMSCPVSESISDRILCLPFYTDLAPDMVDRITTMIRKEL